MTKHAIKEYDDFIADFDVSLKALELMDHKMQLMMGKEVPLVELVDAQNLVDYKIFLRSNQIEKFIDFSDYLDCIKIFDKDWKQKYGRVLNRIGKPAKLKSPMVKTNETVQPEPTKDLPSQETIVSPKNAPILQERIEEPIPPLHSQPEIIAQEKIEECVSHPEILDNNLTSTKSGNPPKNAPQKAKNSRKNYQGRGGQRPKAPQQMIAQPYSIMNSDLTPYLNHELLSILDDIYTLKVGVKWSSFVKLIESGLKGHLLKNTGGSSRKIYFTNPLTGKLCIFVMHEPHNGELPVPYLKQIREAFRKHGLVE